jgi:hypothetical protein
MVNLKKRLTMFVLALSGFVGLGAAGEIVLAIVPGVLPPEAAAIPFMAAHKTSWALRSWILGSNIANLACAVTMMRSVIAIRRGRAPGWRKLRTASGALGGIALLGVLVCLIYLLPLPTGPKREPSRFMLISVVSAGAGLASVCLWLFRYAGQARR